MRSLGVLALAAGGLATGAGAGTALAQGASSSACVVRDSGQADVTATRTDALAKLLAAVPAGTPCPSDVLAFRSHLEETGLTLGTAMVANRGFHNGSAGSFSFFEWARGDAPAAALTLGAGQLFFGHFTGAGGGRLSLERAPLRGVLMIELIAWDAPRG